MKVLYRYESEKTSHGGGLDVNGEYDYSNSWHSMNVELNKYLIYKETEKGYWVSYYPLYYTVLPLDFELSSGENFQKSKGIYRFVLKAGPQDKKRFAYDTEEKALEYFLIRKRKYKRILESKVNDLETVIRIAERMQDKSVVNV